MASRLGVDPGWLDDAPGVLVGSAGRIKDKLHELRDRLGISYIQVHSGPRPVDLRHVASTAAIAPGRFVFGVGVGGDDPDEAANCGVDPTDRGRRTDESLALVRRLLAGETVDHSGPRFPLRRASIRPTPRPGVPVV